MKIQFIKSFALSTMALATTILFSSSCANAQKKNANQSSISQKAPKYIFYFIGDGMSSPQINMAEKAVTEEGFLDIFNSLTANKYNLQPGKLNVRQFTAAGMANTNARNRYITCSAAAATALATGNKTDINRVSMNGEATAPFKTVAEMARDNGMKVGIISSVSVDHATPACFYAHVADRNSYSQIDSFLLESNYDFFGGGFVRWDVKNHIGLDAYKKAIKDKGYKFVNSKAAFQALKPSDGKVIATIERNSTIGSNPDDSALPYNIDLGLQKTENDQIVLAEFVEKAIEMLYNDKKGFFIMTEGGKIDWADHANDAVSNVYETIALDRAIGVALEFYKKHPDETLIVLTGDHECGGLTLGFAGTGYESAFKFMKNQKISYYSFSDSVKVYSKQKQSFDFVLDKVQNYFGLGNKEIGLGLSDFEQKRLKTAYELAFERNLNNMSFQELKLYYGTYEPVTVTVTHILDNKAGVDWASFSHTALPVPVFAIGVGAEVFNGYYDNTDIPKRIMQLAQFK
ncbi:MAG: alkaline phosphatase [Bacteroidales bacterium]|nr:alkaline phosphatase [Bacteroidales bacterium]